MPYAYSTYVAALAILLLAGCKGNTNEAQAETPVPVSVLGPENIAVAESDTLVSGPIVSGTIKPELAATMRAEISGAVVAVPAEAGMPVKKGALLVRIEDAAVRDVYLGARAGERTAEASLTMARRNLERSQRLHAAGAIADRDLEAARVNASAAEGAYADSRARLASANEQLSRTELRAPFSGIVSEVPVSAGDIVSPGTALVTVVDPGTMRLEATVPVDQVGKLEVGTPVHFNVSGYIGRDFDGKITRINPAVDPATRQVRILVSLPNEGSDLVAGLFAEGRAATETHLGVVIPQNAADTRGIRPVVMRLKGGKVEKVEVRLGLTDQVTERTEVIEGLAAGDTVLVGGAQGLSPGTVARVRGE